MSEVNHLRIDVSGIEVFYREAGPGMRRWFCCRMGIRAPHMSFAISCRCLPTAGG